MTSLKTALVTGASQGIGRAIALSLASSGYSVAVCARSEEGLEKVAAEAREAGAPDALSITADLREPDAPARIVNATTDCFGGLGVLVNNAGATKRGDFLKLDDADHLDGFALKYHATVRFCRAAWSELAQSEGVIINISGVGAHTPEAEFTVGGPVNSAIINFSKALSKRPENVRVNVVCPGHIVTDRLKYRLQALAGERDLSLDAARDVMCADLGISDFGDPQDIAAMVRYLCSAQAQYITGATFTIDGGVTPGI
ncbi:SDR family oxidoreductase [Halomonas sp. TRM85114]|uniref:SDR family oxidoreductase n=1 Tax=Halomonas jincaotanensis TaxID=2810616 RepID=UPI001BD38393|nr:SDR family oxidoreductase [Halomonas jincaotanensis]MBS9403664.1 SDR family oxidoreductase [Halomonas jincaotanensis]